jgi:hypothetical protein
MDKYPPTEPTATTLPKFIRKETGLENILTAQLNWLCLFVQSAYNVPKSKVVVYFEKDKKYIYLQPLDEKGNAIDRGKLQICDALKDKNINKMQKGLSEYVKLDGYIIKIVREIPSSVKRSRNVTELA